MINYALKQIKEYHVGVSLPMGDDRNIPIHWNFGFSTQLRPDSLLEVILTAEVVTLRNDQPENLVQLIVGHYFQVDTTDLKKMVADQKNPAFGFMATLLGISLGTVRGLAFARSSGILGDQVFMPVVNPSEMLKNHLETSKLSIEELIFAPQA